MKTIPLTRGQVALVDDEDFARFGNLKWHALRDSRSGNFYAAHSGSKDENGKQHPVRLAREILGITDPRVKVDHKNHHTLDCQRHNLRACTNAQNMANRMMDVRNTSGFRGVSWNSRDQRWQANISFNGKAIHIGNFIDKKEAAAAYADANKKYFGEFGGNLS